MNRISQLGDQILQIQTDLGLSNPKNLNPGMTDKELAASPLFADIPFASELHSLFGWRNGCVPNVPMRQLWFVPGHCLTSAQDAAQSNHYQTNNIPGWRATWFPLMESGSSDFYFLIRPRLQTASFLFFIVTQNFPQAYGKSTTTLNPCSQLFWNAMQRGLTLLKLAVFCVRMRAARRTFQSG